MLEGGEDVSNHIYTSVVAVEKWLDDDPPLKLVG
jgi:hypothetical protein